MAACGCRQTVDAPLICLHLQRHRLALSFIVTKRIPLLGTGFEKQMEKSTAHQLLNNLLSLLASNVCYSSPDSTQILYLGGSSCRAKNVNLILFIGAGGGVIIAFSALIQRWSINYHSRCLEPHKCNYIWVWRVGFGCWPVYVPSVYVCRWWSLPGTTTRATPGGRTSWGLWRETGMLATCLVSVRCLLKAKLKLEAEGRSACCNSLNCLLEVSSSSSSHGR